MNKLLVFTLFVTLQLVGLFSYFKYETFIIGKLTTLFFFLVIIQGFNVYYVIADCLILLMTIVLLYNCNMVTNREGFSNKLKALKETNKTGLKQHFKNSSKNKENMSSSMSKSSLDDYMDGFKDFQFTRKVKNSVDALNKMPLYIKKFKELWK